jgi:2-keto-4-pentenoate hydratase/2-oxohepta-3-ene-1,7-dioic acid hydratase in catechol pathway
MRIVTFRNGNQDPRVGVLRADAVSELAAPSTLAWLEGQGHDRTGAEHALADVELLSPLPVPASYRDFMTFESHAKRTFSAVLDDPEHQVPAYWYEAPSFYFGNHFAFVGPGQPVTHPEGVEWLDLELEVAGVIGGDGEIAAFTLLNDWSARDVQRRESGVGLGLHKSKDFTNSIGPWLVTPDEVGYENGRMRVEAEVELNGESIVRTSNEDQYFTWDQMVAHAARNTRLPAGSVLGSGTLPGGSLIENGAVETGRWLQPGDVVTLRATGLGELTNEIVARGA